MDFPQQLLSHHAYYLISSDSARADLISALATHHKIESQGNPDFFDHFYEMFVIDDARAVKTFHGMRPVTETGKKIFILQMNGVTIEAQNALLKLLEEPAEYAHFFILIPSTHLLLPTVKSRMRFLGETGKEKTTDSELLKIAERLTALSKAKRLEEVKKLIDDISKEKKTRQDAIELLNALQTVVREQKGVQEGASALLTIEMARNYMHDRAPSIKMLLEYVMLNI
jgi:DNA polymerase-3 subunit delta'